MPRARIGLATPAFSGPRSTNELPRHGSNLRFYGKEVALKRENGLHCWLSLSHRLIKFLHPVFFLQDFAGFRAVGRADDSVFFH